MKSQIYQRSLLHSFTLVILSLWIMWSIPHGHAFTLTMYTPEFESHADTGYYLHWQDDDPAGYFVNLYAVASGQPDILINTSPIDAGLTGFEGNEFFWDTSALTETDYSVRLELLDSQQQLVASVVSQYTVAIDHNPTPSGQDIYIYPFIHLKNSFLMGSENHAIDEILTMLDDIGFSQFEFTFNWPIAYYMQNGLIDDHSGSGYLYDPDPDLVDALIDYADAGGAIGSYEPLSGWHYANIWETYSGNWEDWQALGTLAIQYETTYQDQIDGTFPLAYQPGAKHYLDDLFGRKTIELGSNMPVVSFHITRLLGNKVVSQWHPQQIANDSCYRFINNKDYYDGGFMFWYLGQLTFSHYSLSSSGTDRSFDRQILLFSDDYYDNQGIPQHHNEYQSFQEHVDTALGEIHTNGLRRDSFYIFEHSISLENMFDTNYYDSLDDYVTQYGGTYSNWTYSRLARMNCRDTVTLPLDNWEYCFDDSYITSETYLDLRCSVFEDSFQYIQHLAANDPQIHIVTGDDMYDMSRPQADETVTDAQLDRIASYIVNNLYTDNTGSRLPAFIRLENTNGNGQVVSVEYYHLAEAFKLLADALSHQYRFSSLPAQCITKNVIAPTTLDDDMPELFASTQFSLNQVVQAVVQLNLTDTLATSNLWPQVITPAESYMVPSTNYVGLHRVNAAEMLYLMAKTYHQLYSGGFGYITGVPLHVLNEWAYLIQTEDGGYDATRNPAIYIDPQPVGDAPSRYFFNFLQLWTFKPAQIISNP